MPTNIQIFLMNLKNIQIKINKAAEECEILSQEKFKECSVCLQTVEKNAYHNIKNCLCKSIVCYDCILHLAQLDEKYSLFYKCPTCRKPNNLKELIDNDDLYFNFIDKYITININDKNDILKSWTCLYITCLRNYIEEFGSIKAYEIYNETHLSLLRGGDRTQHQYGSLLKKINIKTSLKNIITRCEKTIHYNNYFLQILGNLQKFSNVLFKSYKKSNIDKIELSSQNWNPISIKLELYFLKCEVNMSKLINIIQSGIRNFSNTLLTASNLLKQYEKYQSIFDTNYINRYMIVKYFNKFEDEFTMTICLNDTNEFSPRTAIGNSIHKTMHKYDKFFNLLFDKSAVLDIPQSYQVEN